MSARVPTVNTPGVGRTIAVVGDVYRFLATGDDTGGRYALWEAVVPPGGGPPPHVHSREEEGFYILEGEITFTVGGRAAVEPGSSETPTSKNMFSSPAGATEMSIRAGRLLSFLNACGVPTGMFANVPAVATICSPPTVNVISPSRM